MAENQVPETEIAQELTRIENAKVVFATKAGQMQLKFTDDEGGIRTISLTDPIDEIADAFNNIKVCTDDDLSLADNNQTVKVKAGYYQEDKSKTIPEAGISVATELDDLNGNVSVYVTAENSGYVPSGRIGSDSISIQTPSLTEENIKQGENILGVVGTFTGDATITMTATDVAGVYESDELVEGSTAYARGSKVIGTLLKHPDTPVFFDPLTQTSIDLGTMKYSGQHVKLAEGTDGKSLLLKRLEAI